jgi:hypothetical protein
MTPQLREGLKSDGVVLFVDRTFQIIFEIKGQKAAHGVSPFTWLTQSE